MPGLITTLLTNDIFLSILSAAIISQLAKILIIRLKHKQKFNLNDLIVTGGMPSTHSAIVGSLTVIIWLNQAFSPLFFAVLAFSLITLRDALGVRRSVGVEGKIIEKIIKYEKMKISKFHYSLGHSLVEVFVGLIIGFGSAVFSFNLV